MESYDISHTAGQDMVASMVVFADGKPLKRDYRRFQIKSLDHADDLRALQEVLQRRMQRYLDGDEHFSPLPDLLLMDGGHLQAQATQQQLESMGIHVPILGMVKDDRHRTRALVTPEGRELGIQQSPPLFALVGRVQEEVHRFAITYHHEKHSRSAMTSRLDGIPGIGDVRKKALLKHFKSVKAISQAELVQLEALLPKAAARAESRYIKATADYHSRKFAQEQPEAQSAAARLWHRHKLKREYQRKARETAKQTAKAAEQTVSATERFVREAAAFVKRHPVGTLLALGCLLVVLTLQSCMSSMVSVGNSTLAAIAASTYKAEDADMLGAEAAYCALEDELQRCLDTYTRTHDYDEYHFDLDTIEHDPYVLISMISALHEGAWTLDEVRGTLQDLFDRQYILTEDVVVEVRYRTVTRTDSEGNDYEVEVPYNYYICYVTLENFNLSHVPVYMMSEEQLSMYALYMSTLGNRPDLFPSSGYIGKYITNRPPEHEVPESYLDDETFAAILKEAEKYLGFPYVWGGSSPSTSFDCSGFVSYVYNQCGWSFGRLGAQGLYNICSRTSGPRPGDLVFFVGTYDTAGISHVGIYVGDGWMLHCGDPISYANLNSSYWQSHLYAYGRLP